jgi:O-antigen/teichoic acid export membrane protein
MEEGAGATANPSLTPEPPPEASAGMLHAGRGFIGNAGITLIGAGTGALLTMGADVLAARFLGVSTYGLYALALMLAKSGEIIAEFGVPLSLLHFLPIKLSRGDRESALGAIVGSLLLPITTGLGFTVVLWFGSPWIATQLLGQPAAAPFIAVIGFAIPLMVTIDVLGNVARGFGRALPYVVTYNIVPQLCSAAVLVSLMIWKGPQIGVVHGRVFGYAVGVGVGVIFAWRLARRHIGWVRPVLHLRQLYGYALPLGVNLITTLAIAWTDLFLLGLLTDAKTLGLYRGCMQIALVFDLAANACAAALAPVFTVLIAAGLRARLQETYTSAVRLLTLMTLPLLLVIMINSADLLRILGPEFAIGAPALLILACGQFAKVTFSPATVALIIGGRQRLDAVNVAVAAVANLTLNLLFIPFFGLRGAALATATSLFGLAIVRCLQIHHVFGLRTLDFALFRAAVVMTPLAVAVWAASVSLGIGPGTGFLALSCRLALTALAIGGGSWLFCLESGDRTMLRATLRRGSGAAPTTRMSTTQPV